MKQAPKLLTATEIKMRQQEADAKMLRAYERFVDAIAEDLEAAIERAATEEQPEW